MNIGFIIQEYYSRSEMQQHILHKELSTLAPTQIAMNLPFQSVVWEEKAVRVVVLIGSLSFVRNTKVVGPDGHPIQTHHFLVSEVMTFSKMLHLLHPSQWVNSEGFMLPLHRLPKSEKLIRELVSSRSFFTDTVFMRPESCLKVCEASVIRLDEIEQVTSDLKATSGVTDTTLIWLFPRQSILREYRFVVNGKGEVVTGSTYSLKGDAPQALNHEEEGDVFQAAQSFASEIHKRLAEPFVLDVAKCLGYQNNASPTPEEASSFKVVEVNSASTSGLYQCDLEKVAQALYEASLLAVQELFDDECLSASS